MYLKKRCTQNKQQFDKGEKSFGAYKVDKGFMVFYLQSTTQLTLACFFLFLNHSPKDSSTEIRNANSNFS